MAFREKYQRLQRLLQTMGTVLIAYSGGVDSTFLLKVARDTLGDQAIGVLGISGTVTPAQVDEARRLAASMDATFLTVTTDEFSREEFVSNPSDRCYHCKTALFERLWEIAREKNIPYILDGNNADDQGDYRPGMEAARHMHVRSPLLEAGLTKQEIRILSQELELPTWNRPSSPCLSSRLPYGIRITSERLNQIAQAEAYLKELGFAQVRARYHNDIVRIEVDPQQMTALVALATEVVQFMKSIGFIYVTLDLAGFRSGSLNESLSLQSAHK
ncbi:ATP-dependent sacrificial sulfur transferase LarE [Heliophilum fasciatum]|uniref:NAD/GMP synthase domain-containing protein n=1 Tax=Heliophilum fasciatum TaxID=35700 RepID=A0A4R2RZ61_9FIRM|nr:ATP-dependent sacrificial sulfur transferase LarE [Heliophilum fasciatum]MCW2277985.1 uncharacterized protein [Heliophilum fasciatum]TCP64395.1 uncharacterized protein EDD73_11094 [Heliophilum fasciatum]